VGDISPHFSRHEAICKCGCGFFIKDAVLIQRLEEMRELLQEPLYINSWCRCKPYNTLEGGNKNSEHMDGQAADIRIGDSMDRAKIIWLAWHVGFRRVGAANTFVHVDTDMFKPQDVLWLYK